MNAVDTKIRPEDERQEEPNVKIPTEAVSQGAPVKTQSDPNSPSPAGVQQAGGRSSVPFMEQHASPSAARVPAVGGVRPGVYEAPPAVGDIKQPSPASDSVDGMFYNIYDRANQEKEAANKRRNEIFEGIRKAQKEGRDVRTVLFERMKPVRDAEKEDRIRKMGLAMAIGNLLSAIGTGIVAFGPKGRGYAPQNIGNKYPHEALAQLNKMEEDYLQQDKEYKQMELQWANAEQERQDKMLHTQLAMAKQDLAGKQQRLNALEDLALKNQLSSAQEKEMLRLRSEISEKQAEIEHKHRMKQIAAQTAGQKEAAMIRGYFNSKDNDEDDKSIAIYDRDGRTKILLKGEDVGKYYEAGLKLGVIPIDGTVPDYGDEKFYWKNLDNGQKAMYLRQAYIAANYVKPQAVHNHFDPNSSAEPHAGQSQPDNTVEKLRRRGFSEEYINWFLKSSK